MSKIVNFEEYRLHKIEEQPVQAHVGADAVEALKYITNNTVVQIRHTPDNIREECDWVPAIYLGRMTSTAENLKDEDAYFFLLPGMAIIEILQDNMRNGDMWVQFGADIDREEFEELMNNLMEWTLQVNEYWG